MTQSLYKYWVFFLTASIVTGGLSTSVHAGFEWKGATSPPAPAVQYSQQRAQEKHDMRYMSPQNEMTGLEPVIMWDGEPAHAMPMQAVPNVMTMPVSDYTGYAVSENVAPVVLEGFASDIPLAIALQQVAPAGHQFSFSSEVNPGLPVSWQGGKPWKKVLTAMLETHGLSYRLQGNVLTVGNFPPVRSAPVVVDIPPMVTLTPAPVVVAGATPQAPQTPMNIRRSQKPASLLERIGFKQADKINEPEDVSKFDRIVAAPSGPVPVHQTAPAPVAEQKQAVTPWQKPKWQAESSYKDDYAQSPASAKAVMPTEAVPVAVSQPTEIAADIAVPSMWQAARGQTLRTVLRTWSDKADVKLYWTIDYDYKLGGDLAFNGGYDNAVAELLASFTTIRPQPYGKLHRGEQGKKVLVIKSYDLEG